MKLVLVLYCKMASNYFTFNKDNIDDINVAACPKKNLIIFLVFF